MYIPIVLSPELDLYVGENTNEELEVDLVGDISNTIRVEDKILFTVSVSVCSVNAIEHLWYWCMQKGRCCTICKGTVNLPKQNDKFKW